MININDIFWTFQGEGRNTGRRALFIRLPFCNLKCSWCDTEFNSFKSMTQSELINFRNLEPNNNFVVITGGEPMMNKHLPILLQWLDELAMDVAIETNGSFDVIDAIRKYRTSKVFITCSPKADNGFKIASSLCGLVDDLKLVVDDSFDFQTAKHFESLLLKNDSCHFYLSPEFNNFETNVKRIEAFISENGHWKLNLQTHKWIGVK